MNNDLDFCYWNSNNMDDVELAIFVPADFNPDGINNISPDEMI